VGGGEGEALDEYSLEKNGWKRRRCDERFEACCEGVCVRREE